MVRYSVPHGVTPYTTDPSHPPHSYANLTPYPLLHCYVTENYIAGCDKECENNKHCLTSLTNVLDLFTIKRRSCECDSGYKINDNDSCNG